ncbi:MAG: CCA tRNA nucleotidyltransferase [Holosporaceae bacterium]|jgi:tRNA nucleotidyltransferase/poly(A) polymerase|nr:CCA tRNA nucleotidyltransferase [Holosporaceae bacterium]
MDYLKKKSPIDGKAFFILDLIEKYGYAARIVGGAVRNFLMDIEFSDIDIATTATPVEILDICNANNLYFVPTGIKYGSVLVVYKNKPYEITTLREDVKAFGRHTEVKFTKSFEADAARRDFTINAIYMDKEGEIYDYNSGIKDIRNKNIRFIGNAQKRIEEDYLRILRYFRFVVTYGNYRCNQEYLNIISKLKTNLRILSSERIISELLKIFATPDSYKAVLIMREVLDELFLLKTDSLNACEKLKIFDSLSASERFAMLLKFAKPPKEYNFPKNIREMINLKIVDFSQLFQQLKRTKKEYREFYVKFITVNSFLNEKASDISLKELLDFCRSDYIDFQLKADDLKSFFPTKDELKKVMMAVKQHWLDNNISPEECKSLASKHLLQYRKK